LRMAFRSLFRDDSAQKKSFADSSIWSI
jgi:hypothetical protein